MPQGRILYYLRTWLHSRFTDEDLAVSTAFVGIDKNSPQSINDILQISGRSDGYINKYLLPFKTGFLNLLNYQDLYLTSANLGNFEVLGVRGEGSVIRKICANAGWGYSIVGHTNVGF